MRSQDFQPYTNPSLRYAIRRACQEAVQEVAPEEAGIPQEFIDSLIEEYENGSVLVVDMNAETEGGFGHIDMVTLLIVPLVNAVLQKFLEEVVSLSFERFKEWVKQNQEEKERLEKEIERLVGTEYPVIAQQVKSRKARKNEKAVKQAVRRALIHLLNLLG